MNIHDNVLGALGNTPIVKLNRIGRHTGANLWVKLEYLNPGGSVKDRIALQIIEDAERQGLIRPGGTIVEATSGNTGMGLAMVAAIRGYKTVFVMPDKMSEEKIRSLRAFGAKVVITPTDVAPEDPRSYYMTARRIADETPNAFYANQYHNPSNPLAHYRTTGPEIWEQTGGTIDVFVSAAGTGGTISGTGRFLKEMNPDIRIVAADPIGSLYYDYFHTGQLTEAHSYKVEGFGEDFLPSTMDFNWVDEVVRVTDKECFDATRRLVREEGIYTGGSSGGAIAAAVKYAEMHQKPGDRPLNIVAIMCDSASRYLSKIFDDGWMRENGFLGDDLSQGNVQDLLVARGTTEVWTAHPGATVREVVTLLKTHGVSQLPVMADGHVVGIVSERRLLDFLVHGGSITATIDGLVEKTFATVAPTDRIATLGQLVSRDLTVLVTVDGSVTSVLTRIDFIDWVTRSLA